MRHSPLSLIADRRKVEKLFQSFGAVQAHSKGGHSMMQWQGRRIPLGHSSYKKELEPMVARRLQRTWVQVTGLPMSEYVRRLQAC